MVIKGILVSSLAPFENHMANNGEKLLGNASSIKRRPDGCVYISGQMQRHVLFTAMARLNEADPNKGKTFVSNGDGVTNKIESDLRADMGGFMQAVGRLLFLLRRQLQCLKVRLEGIYWLD